MLYERHLLVQNYYRNAHESLKVFMIVIILELVLIFDFIALYFSLRSITTIESPSTITFGFPCFSVISRPVKYTRKNVRRDRTLFISALPLGCSHR